MMRDESLLTWYHCTPAETPASCCITAIRVEEDFHSVAPGRYHWRQEVQGRRWIRVAAAVVHQGCPVPIGDLDKVTWAGDIDRPTSMNSKVCELQPQYLTTLNFYGLRLVKIVRIVVRVVWRGDTTCGF